MICYLFFYKKKHKILKGVAQLREQSRKTVSDAVSFISKYKKTSSIYRINLAKDNQKNLQKVR
jgi:hypothetical protein